MKVLMISGDRHTLEIDSEAYKRLELQRGQVDKLDVFVWPQVHSLFEIFNTARRVRYDVITAQDPFWRGLLALFIAKLAGGRLNIQVHADLVVQSLGYRLIAYLVLRHSDSVRVVSEKIKEQVLNMGVSAPIFILPVFVNLERFRLAKRNPTGQPSMILWVGRFEPEKDPLLAVDVLRKVRHSGVDAKLVMLGKGSMEYLVKERAGELPVELPGWIDPLPYLERADVVLSTSKYESWGASIVEALAAGVPVVARDVGVAREAGATIREREALHEAVAEILRSPMQGVLKLRLLNAQEWAIAWRETIR